MPTATLTLAEASLKAIAVAPEDIPARITLIRRV
jgi:hypothetical protein